MRMRMQCVGLGSTSNGDAGIRGLKSFWRPVQTPILNVHRRGRVRNSSRAKRGSESNHRCSAEENSPGAVAIVTKFRAALVACTSKGQRQRQPIGRITYAEMVRVAFSPSDMGWVVVEPRMPSSQPVQQRQSIIAPV